MRIKSDTVNMPIHVSQQLQINNEQMSINNNNNNILKMIDT